MAKNIVKLSAPITKLVLSASIFFLLLSPALRAQAPSPQPAPIPSPSQPPPGSPNNPTPAPTPNPTAGTSPSSHMMRTWRQLSYSCDDNLKVIVNLHATNARVVFKGHTYNMKQVDESDGQKYTDGSLVWRNKGEDGSLERESKASQNKKLATGCHLQSVGTNPSGTPAATTPLTQK